MRKIITLALVMAMSLPSNAQTIATNYKKPSSVNPISGCVFCADPTALEYNGRLYVYGSNDNQEFVANGKKGKNTYAAIKSIVVFSTDDMVNWTFHGTIDVAKLCYSWSPGWRWWRGFHNSWAPSVTWRHNNTTGKDEFFLYFANNSHGVGVLKASSPIGPWYSPLSESLIGSDTSGAVQDAANFDPGVVIDENGTGWLTFGGLGPGVMQPNAARIVKLKPSMTALDGSAVAIPAPYHFEANELNIMNGKYVYTYCTNWASNDPEWNIYKAEKGISAARPDWCTMCYMVSDNPTDPNSWVFKGAYGPNSTSNNNHSHLQKFQGQYYHLYHGAPLMLSMRSAGVLTSEDAFYRSICVAKATVDEATQTIKKVDLNNPGVSPIKPLNPYQLQQAETMASSGGVNYEDFLNLQPVTSKSNLGNDASANMYIKMAAGAWTVVRNVDFGQTGARSFVLRAKGSGTLEIRTDKDGQAVATMAFSSTEMKDHVLEIDPAIFKGTKSYVFFVFTQADNVQFDAWQFFDTAPSSIMSVPETQSQPSVRYDLSGRRLSGTSHSGLVIEQYQDANGITRTRKHF